MIGDITIFEKNVELTLNISTDNTEKKDQVVKEIKLVLSKHFSVVDVKILSKKNQTAMSTSIKNNGAESSISNVKHIIAIASGKEA